MPMHNGWLPREGLTIDPIGRLIKKTALNPVLPLLVILAARFTKQGSELAILHDTAYSRIHKLLYFGLVRWASSYLDSAVLNNWQSDKYDWEKEIVLITGGAGGIGGQVVRLLAERGIKVVVMDVIPMTFETPANVFYYKCDITSTSLIASTAAKIRKDVGDPTVLINNAGVARGKNILDATETDVRFTFEVNTLSHYWMVKEFLPGMVRRDHGMVVTVSSLAAYLTVANMTDYASSKAASLAFHEGLTSELNSTFKAPKVRTVIVNQGFTKTPLFDGCNNRTNQFVLPDLEPETVAEAIVRKVLTGQSGQVVVPGAGNTTPLYRAMPHWLQLTIRAGQAKFMQSWNGRQVIDVKQWNTADEKNNLTGESESTVLVPPVKN